MNYTFPRILILPCWHDAGLEIRLISRVELTPGTWTEIGHMMNFHNAIPWTQDVMINMFRACLQDMAVTAFQGLSSCTR